MAAAARGELSYPSNPRRLPVMKTAHVAIHHPDLGLTTGVPVNDFDAATPAGLLRFLEQNAWLPKEDPSRPYLVQAEGRDLHPDRSLSEQRIGPSTTIIILRGFTAAGGVPC